MVLEQGHNKGSQSLLLQGYARDLLYHNKLSVYAGNS
jgi:hypothetical protein